MVIKITSLDLREISLVEKPANPATVINNLPLYLAEKYGLIPKEDAYA
jgi:hypothetical protein